MERKPMKARRPGLFVSRSLLAVSVCFVAAHFWLPAALGQSVNATLSGTVTDQNGAIVPNINVIVLNLSTATKRETTTNEQGSFTVPLLPPGTYTVKVSGSGFTPIEIPNVVLNVGDQKALQIQLKAGDVNAQVTVDSSAETVRTDPAVATVINRQFVSSIPLNGRSFQTLIALTPGVNITASNQENPGQFSVNGQRTSTNYFQVDGVSANFGITAGTSNYEGFAGAHPALTTAGGTNGLVSVDALEEFRVQTSTYAPEFGRMPGAQIQILTRSGGNAFHGSVFDYLRNEVLDANDWFANRAGLPKATLRQNDFGGTLSGPVMMPRFGEGGRQPGFNGKNRLFFFFSYEGLRLQQPQTSVSVVPSLSLRQSAGAALRPLLAAFARPNGPDIINPANNQPTGMARFTANYSDSVRLNATSIRIDYKPTTSFSLFGRYNESPSTSSTRLALVARPNSVRFSNQSVRTLTLGADLAVSPRLFNEIRFNYSQQRGAAEVVSDSFGDAVVPPKSTVYPVTFNPQTDLIQASFSAPGAAAVVFYQGVEAENRQRQFQVIDTASALVGAHSIKFGGDWRMLQPQRASFGAQLLYFFRSIADIQNGIAPLTFINRFPPNRFSLHNLSFFGQDSWAISPKLKLTYGLRWDLNPPPSLPAGQEPAVIQGTDSPAHYHVGPRGTPMYRTIYTNFAPRLGLAYRLKESVRWGTTLRGGAGLFYDLGSDDATAAFTGFPFEAHVRLRNEHFPLQGADATLPEFITSFTPPIPRAITSYAEDFSTPRSWQWSATVDQQLGSANSLLNLSYVGSHGEHLLANDFSSVPNSDFLDSVTIFRTIATSDYHALQAEYTWRHSRGFEARAGYTWSKAIDEASDTFSTFQLLRGSANFDIRHVLSAAFTYEPKYFHGRSLSVIFDGWSVSGLTHWQTAPPVDVIATAVAIVNDSIQTLRPNLLLNVPVYIHDPSLAGGRAINYTVDPSRPGCLGPFCLPADGTQGNLGRNAVRGFGAWQVDFALKRAFPLNERVRLSFSLEAFNIFNHPNFGQPEGDMESAQFGQSSAMLGRFLGGLSPVYQIGGPRSLQVTARIQF